MDDDAGGEAEEAMDLAHHSGVAAGQVIVDGDDVNAFARERIEVAGKGGDERFAFTGAHFGDASAVKRDAADQLNVVVALADHAPGGFANDRESFGQELIEGFAFGEALL